MKKLLLLALGLTASTAYASQHKTPECYADVPTSCSFNEMTLQLCNEEGKSQELLFLPSQRIRISGGNKFATADGEHMCIVRGIKGSSPKKYDVTIQE